MASSSSESRLGDHSETTEADEAQKEDEEDTQSNADDVGLV